jgi:hypothetical protein
VCALHDEIPSLSQNSFSIDREESVKIVKELGCLPLAIEQAGAYIDARKLPISAYLPAYQKGFSEVMSKIPRGPNRYRETAYTTWELSFKAIEPDNPAAIRLLLFLAFLSNDVWDELLKRGRDAMSTGE